MKQQFSDIIRRMIKFEISNIHTSIPGQIEKYDYTKKKASVKPMIKRKMDNGDILTMPVIENVPVIFPSTGDTIIHFPLKKGDGCMILFSERSLDEFLSLGIDTAPDDPRKYDLTDAICLPGLYNFSNPGKIGSGNEDLEIIFKDSVIKISSDGKVTINGGGKRSAREGDATLSDSTTDSSFWTMWAAFFGVVTGPPIPEPGNGAPSAFQTALSLAIAGAGGTPTSQTGKINEGSDTVEVGD